LGINLVFAWTDPTGDPPFGNVAAPINIGSTSQTKDGDLAVDKLTVNDRYIYFGSQSLYGDNSSALYWKGNHDTVTQMIFKDKQDTVYGRVYGSGDGVHFGLLSADGTWGVRTTDSLTEIYHSTYLPTVYANIMYDRDNTGYYVDPDGTSKLKCIRLGTETKCSWPSGAAAESDTLDTVCDRGHTTNQTITTSGSIKAGNGKAVMQSDGTIVANLNAHIKGNLVVDDNNWGATQNKTVSHTGYTITKCLPGYYMIGIETGADKDVYVIKCAEL